MDKGKINYLEQSIGFSEQDQQENCLLTNNKFVSFSVTFFVEFIFFLPIPKSFGEMMSISQFNVEQPAAAFVLFQAYHLRSVASCCDCSLVNLEQGPIFGYQVRADCLDNEHDKNLYDGQLWRYY